MILTGFCFTFSLTYLLFDTNPLEAVACILFSSPSFLSSSSCFLISTMFFLTIPILSLIACLFSSSVSSFSSLIIILNSWSFFSSSSLRSFLALRFFCRLSLCFLASSLSKTMFSPAVAFGLELKNEPGLYTSWIDGFDSTGVGLMYAARAWAGSENFITAVDFDVFTVMLVTGPNWVKYVFSSPMLLDARGMFFTNIDDMLCLPFASSSFGGLGSGFGTGAEGIEEVLVTLMLWYYLRWPLVDCWNHVDGNTSVYVNWLNHWKPAMHHSNRHLMILSHHLHHFMILIK